MPMREAIHGLRGDFLCLRKVQRASGSVEVSWCDYANWPFQGVHGISLEKSPYYFSGSRTSEDVGIAHGPPRSL